MTGGRYPILHASEAAKQPIPQYLNLTYGDLFKIQRVTNPFPLRPVSFSRLTSYLECPNCALAQQRKKRAREPQHFTPVHQGSLFASREPDPRLIGTLLHAIIDLLHDSEGPLEDEQQRLLLIEPDVLTRFIQYDLLDVLQKAGKLRLALFLDEIASSKELLFVTVLHPLVKYQQELLRNGSTVFASSERFQFKLLSTGNTFAGHRDWGGYVGLIGEFDQIRLLNRGSGCGKPAIMEFKKGLGKKRNWDRLATQAEESESEAPGQADDLVEPGLAHAFQLMVYWLAFQTRWDIMERIRVVKGQIDELPMPLHQELELIIYNLHDGCQYQLVPTDLQAALQAVINCIFYTNWALKSGYAWQAPEHDCGKTPLVSAAPNPLIQVGTNALSAEKCYELAKEAFQRFSETVCWHKLPLAAGDIRG